MKKTEHQRRAYALRRLSRAVDRSIVSTDEHEKLQAKKWATLWARKAKL